MPDAADPSDWRARLRRADAASAPTTPLALLFQLRAITRGGSRWTTPKAQSVRAPRPGSEHRLAVRPAVRSATGGWVTSSVGWGSLGFTVERLRLDPAQVGWFSRFAAMHRAGGDGYRTHEPDWLHLDEVAGALLWPALDEAEALGIRLVTPGRPGTVTRATDAGVLVEVRRAEVAPGDAAGPDAPEHPGDLEVRTVATIGGEEVEPSGLLGAQGFYLWGDGVVLAPLPAAEAEALCSGGTVRIPTADESEFWRGWFPRIARRTAVVGSGVELPETREETVLVVEHGPRDSIATRWESRVGDDVEPVAEGPVEVPATLRGVDAAAFVAERIPELAEAGIRVVETGRRPAYRRRDETPRLSMTAVPSEHRDWLELGFVVTVGRATVPFAKLFAALARGRTRLLLVDKSYLRLDQPVFDPLRELIAEGDELEEWSTGLRISRYRATLLEPFQDLADQRPDALAWRVTAAALRDEPPAINAPATLTAELRPYQLDGFRWLAHLQAHGLGGVLADDMGLGKTLQAIAAIAHARQEHPDAAPALIVAPSSVLGTWASEAARFAPGLSVAVLDRVGAAVPANADAVVTSYAILRLDRARFSRLPWSSLWLDEAQTIKNPASQIHQTVAELDVPVRFALTGTPLENGLLDLWAIFRVVAPGLFPSRIRFSDRYVKVVKAERIEELRRRIRPLMLRRTKETVASELPERQEQTIRVELAPDHRALYERYLQRERQKVLGLVDDLDRQRFIVFRSLTLLRMLALDATLIDAELEAPSSKLDVLVERLREVAAEGHRALVFSQFTSYLALARERLAREGIASEYLDGSTRRREDVIRSFREGDAPVFLISLRAGGVGLTLTEADYVFLLDPWWNPAAEQQAIDRAHRIGQRRPVMVYRLVAADTIEEKVLALASGKRRLFDEVVDDGEFFSAPITAADVRALLE